MDDTEVSQTTAQAVQTGNTQPPANGAQEKFCKHCGKKIAADAVVCVHCGRQVEELRQAAAPQIVINNENNNQNTNQNVNQNVNRNGYAHGRPKNKWTALLLCLFLGVFGGHKFYEGKTGMGILYLCTGGLCLIGVVIDLITILGKPSIYYV